MGKEPECPPPGLPMWMATYSDLVTLLLTFFVLLLTMASMDPIKFIQAKTSIEYAFGWSTKAAPVPFSIPLIPSPPKSKFTPIPQQAPIQHFKRIKTDLEMTKIDNQVEAVQKDNDSVILRINERVLFEPGKTELNPASYPILRKVADIIRPLPLTMRIEGHTDATPHGKRPNEQLGSVGGTGGFGHGVLSAQWALLVRPHVRRRLRRHPTACSQHHPGKHGPEPKGRFYPAEQSAG